MSSPPNTSASDSDAALHSGPVHKRITPSTVGKFVNLNQCPRYFKYGIENVDLQDAAGYAKDDFKEAFRREAVLEKKAGDDFEEAVVDQLKPQARTFIDFEQVTAADVRDAEDDDQARCLATKEKLDTAIEMGASLPAASDPFILFQPHFSGVIGNWEVNGAADIVLIWPDRDSVTVRVIDIKNSNDEQAHQQIQTAIYSLLIKQTTRHQVGTDYSLETGVLISDADTDSLAPEDLPTFDRESREGDVIRLLKDGGKLDKLYHQSFDETDYQLETKCASCPFNEACFSMSVENAGLELIGIGRGLQQTLSDHGIDTLHDLAEVAYPPDEHQPNEFDTLTPRDEETYQQLSSLPGIGERLAELVQRAQAMLGKIDPDAPHAHDERDAPWITRSGYGTLPDDNPAPSMDTPYKRGSLIRIYLNIQHDHIRDRLAGIGARVNATASDIGPEHVSAITPSAPDNDNIADQVEYALLESFLEDLFETVQSVADGIDFSDATHDNPPIHFYVYGNGELDSLDEALMRHVTDGPDSRNNCDALRDLIGQRDGIDQSMVGVVKSEATGRVAPKTPSTGLLPMYTQFSPYDDDAFKSPSDWTYEPEDPSRLPDGRTTVDLQDAFRYNLFDYSVPYEDGQDGIDLLLGNTDSTPDGWYPSRARFGAQMPLTYIYAAIGRIDNDWVEDVESNNDSNAPLPVTPFRYHSYDDARDEVPIVREDVAALIEHFTHALAHIEQGLDRKDATMEKHPVPVDDLDSFCLPEPTLASACKEYLDLEYQIQRDETLEHYAKHWKQRLRTGESIYMQVSDVEERDGTLHVTGQLAYEDHLSAYFDNPERLLQAIRKKDDQGAASGSWMIATPLNGETNTAVDGPEDVERSTPVTIDRLNIDDGEIKVSARRVYSQKDPEYQVNHRGWTTEETNDRWEQTFAPGKLFILDPRTDQITAEKAATALDHAYDNDLYNLLDSIRSGDRTDVETTAFNEEALNAAADWMQTSDELEISPNPQQDAFIRDGNSELTLLQGPPGTGKTSGAVSRALIARALARGANGERARMLVSGPTNKAIDEVLEKVDELVRKYRDDPDTDGELENLRLVRLADRPANADTKIAEYIDYYNDEAERLQLADRLLERQQHVSSLDQDAGEEHTIIFATPTRAWGFANMLTPEYDAEELMAERGLYDVMCVDEASMMTMPDFILAGSFYDSGGQVIVGGDHRQMPPVQQYEWEDETRPSIRRFAPYLSALDFCRLIVGDTPDSIANDETLRDQVAVAALDNTTSVDVEPHQLEVTYRCHSEVADFLQRWVYQHDGLDYRSNRTHTIDPPEPVTDGVAETVAPDTPLVLVTYDDERSQQSNPVEALLAHRIVSSLTLNGPDDESVGIVTPHNAQRGRLQRQFAVDNTISDPVDVETVERYQGGERDTMLVSGTVSDPDFVASESDFLLNLNRVNVAMSRMKKMLIVIASEALFEHIPLDIDEYRDAMLWKGLSQDLGVLDDDTTAAWSGTLGDFTGVDSTDDAYPPDLPADALDDISLSVYTL